MKRAKTYKGLHPYQSEFSHRYACWASNHRGWAKMKKFNRRLAKRRLRQKWRGFDCETETLYTMRSKRGAGGGITMGMDMYIDKIRRNPNDKSVVEREQLCYWRKFWALHNALALYGTDDYANDVRVIKADVERAIAFATHNEDFFGGFDSVPSLCELLRDFDQYEEDGYEIVYNANW